MVVGTNKEVQFMYRACGECAVPPALKFTEQGEVINVEPKTMVEPCIEKAAKNAQNSLEYIMNHEEMAAKIETREGSTSCDQD